MMEGNLIAMPMARNGASGVAAGRMALVASVVSVLLAGCAGVPRSGGPAPSATPLPSSAMQSAFDPAEHERYRRPGTALVNGQAFLRDGSSSLVTCEGGRVTMLPATKFFREAVDTMAQGKRPVAVDRIDPAFRGVMRDAPCDNTGAFRFANVPAGRWQLLTKIQWDAAGALKGGWLVREVNVTDGQTLGVRLGDSDLRERR